MGRDRGPLLSSLVLVGLATVATALLVLIGVQAVKLPFDPRNTGNETGRDGREVVSVPTVSDTPPVVVGPRPTTQPTSGPAATSRPTSGRTSEPRGTTRTQGTSGSNTGTGGGTNPTTAPKPAPPAPAPSTSTSRPKPPATQSPAPTPSPTCTARDRTGKCKTSNGNGNGETAAPTPPPPGSTGTTFGSGAQRQSAAPREGARDWPGKSDGRATKRRGPNAARFVPRAR